ncbi:hypothetical protein ACL7DC_16295 [Bordetella pertussis]
MLDATGAPRGSVVRTWWAGEYIGRNLNNLCPCDDGRFVHLALLGGASMQTWHCNQVHGAAG